MVESADSGAKGTAIAWTVSMIVAFDMAKYPIIRNGDLHYPGVASLLAIITCGGQVIIYNSAGALTLQEKRLIDKLIEAFGGKITYGRDSQAADMSVD